MSTTIHMTAEKQIYPDTDNTGSLGTSSYKWNNVFATNFTGNLSGSADLLDGQHGSYYQNASNLNAGTLSYARLPSIMPYRTLRDFTNGTLITTDLPGNSDTLPFLCRIYGNGYGGGIVVAECQGYIYNISGGYTSYISTDAYAIGNFASKFYAFNNANNKLCFWFARINYWQGFDVVVYHTVPGENVINHVVSVTDSALPSSRTLTTEINIRTVLTSSNYTSYISTSAFPAGFASNTPGATWGNTTGTSFASWNDSTGGSIDWRRDNPSSGKLSLKVDGRVYVNEGLNPCLSASHDGNYWGMASPDGETNVWIRTTSSGIIPHTNGGAGSGHDYLGTSSWYFSQAYIDNIYGYLNGSCSGSSSSTSRLSYTGTQNGCLSAYQGSGSFMGNSGWTSYIICNHGDGATYYHQTIGLPFWSSPFYTRMEGGSQKGIWRFHTTENVGWGSSLPSASFTGQIYLKYA